MRGARRAMLGLAAAAIVLVLHAAPDAGAVVACQKGKKKVTLREKCRKKEKQVVVEADPGLPPTAAELLALLAGVDGAGSGLDADTLRGHTPADIAAGAGLVVRDANGAVVGRALDQGSIAREVSGLLLRLPATREGFPRTESSGFVEYASADCSGQPLIEPGRTFVLASVVLGGLAYHEDRSQSPVAVSVQSRRSYGTPTDECTTGTHIPPDECCQAVARVATVVPAQTLDLTALGFVPPFRVDPE